MAERGAWVASMAGSPPKKNSWGNSSSQGGRSRGADAGGHSEGMVARGSGEPDGTSRGSGEPDGTSRGSGEPDGTSRGSGEPDRNQQGHWRAGRDQQGLRRAGRDQQGLRRAGRSRHWRTLARSQHWRALGKRSSLVGTREAQTLGGALAAQTLGGALAARSWTGPARTTKSWTGPAEKQERACEERPQEGAVLEPAQEGADLEPAQEGAVLEPTLGGALEARSLGDALEARVQGLGEQQPVGLHWPPTAAGLEESQAEDRGGAGKSCVIGTLGWVCGGSWRGVSARGLVVLGWGRMMIARNNIHFEINTIDIENMINQLDQGKTARGKIAADNVIIQPQPKTDTERGVNPAHLVVELKNYSTYSTKSRLSCRRHLSLSSAICMFWYGFESSVTVHGGARNEEARNFFPNTLFNTEIAGDKYTYSMTLRLNT